MKDWARGLLYDALNPKQRWEWMLIRIELAALVLLAGIFIIGASTGGDDVELLLVYLLLVVTLFANRLLLTLFVRGHERLARDMKGEDLN